MANLETDSAINLSSVYRGSNFNQGEKTDFLKVYDKLDKYVIGREVILFTYIQYITEYFKSKK